MKEDFHSYMKKEYEKIFNEDWFFDKITHQRAEELLIEKGRRGDFLVREDLEEGNFFLIWLDQEKYVEHVRIFKFQRNFHIHCCLCVCVCFRCLMLGTNMYVLEYCFWQWDW